MIHHGAAIAASCTSKESGTGCRVLPDVLGGLGVVVDLLRAVLQVVHVEEARGIVHDGLELDVVGDVGIHRLADDDAAYADVGGPHHGAAAGGTRAVLVAALHEAVVAQALVDLGIEVVVVGVALIADVAGHVASAGVQRVLRRLPEIHRNAHRGQLLLVAAPVELNHAAAVAAALDGEAQLVGAAARHGRKAHGTLQEPADRHLVALHVCPSVAPASPVEELRVLGDVHVVEVLVVVVGGDVDVLVLHVGYLGAAYVIVHELGPHARHAPADALLL